MHVQALLLHHLSGTAGVLGQAYASTEQHLNKHLHGAIRRWCRGGSPGISEY